MLFVYIARYLLHDTTQFFFPNIPTSRVTSLRIITPWLCKWNSFYKKKRVFKIASNWAIRRLRIELKHFTWPWPQGDIDLLKSWLIFRRVCYHRENFLNGDYQVKELSFWRKRQLLVLTRSRLGWKKFGEARKSVLRYVNHAKCT